VKQVSILGVLQKIPEETALGFLRLVRLVLPKGHAGTNSGANLIHKLDEAERLLKYSMAIRRRELKRLVIFVTDSCHSRCLHCGIWRIKNPVFLPLATFRRILNEVDPSVDIILTGGEALEHPQIEEMLSMLTTQKKQYTLLSNGNYPERLITLVRKYHVPEVILSCDGMRETYKRMRGVDWFPNIEHIVRELRGECKIALTYVVSFWNNRKDLMEVMEFANTNGASLSVGLHGDCASVKTKIPIRLKKLYPVSDLIVNRFARRYYALYTDWLEGKVKLPCFSVRFTGVVYADERFGICEAKDIIVGNLRERGLKEIWNDPATAAMQIGLIGCNGCWLTHYRRNDVIVSELMAKFVPDRVLDSLIGDFDWDKVTRPLSKASTPEDTTKRPLLELSA
jgi:MoaA/NifB/PqqE/SkfB family radical SAM enzyme